MTKTKLPTIIAATLLTAAALPLHATITYDFETVPTSPIDAGSLTSLSQTSGGVTATFFRSSGAAFDVVDLSSYTSIGLPTSWGRGSLSPFLNSSVADIFVVNFSSAINAADISFGDFGADDDSPVTLTAYAGMGASGAVVNSSTTSYPGSTGSDFVADFLSVAGPNIESISFSSGGTFPNTLFWDNLDITPDATSGVPETCSTFGLLGLSLVGLVGLRGRITRAKTV